MIKITVDTNVLVSATFWRGASFRIIQMVEDKKVKLILSPDIIEEYIEILQGQKFRNANDCAKDSCNVNDG